MNADLDVVKQGMGGGVVDEGGKDNQKLRLELSFYS